MATGRRYLVDKSAFVRAHLEPVNAVIDSLLDLGCLTTCAIVDLEVLYSARSPGEYLDLLTKLRVSYARLPITQEICARALDVQGQLAKRSQQRGCGVTDLVIAACAEVHEVTVLHYDRDFELIASITGQSVLWVVPPGSVP